MSVAERVAKGAATGREPLISRLRAAAGALSSSPAAEEVARAVLANGMQVSGAAAGVAAVLDADGAQLHLVASSGYSAAFLADWQSFSVQLDTPLTNAVKFGRPVVVNDAVEIARRYPARPSDGPHALGAFPIFDESRVVGGIGLRFELRPAGAPWAGREDAVLVATLRERIEQLQRALDSRVLIEQAKGVLAERHGESPDQACKRLRGHARARGQRLQKVAADVVAGRLPL